MPKLQELALINNNIELFIELLQSKLPSSSMFNYRNKRGRIIQEILQEWNGDDVLYNKIQEEFYWFDFEEDYIGNDDIRIIQESNYISEMTSKYPNYRHD